MRVALKILLPDAARIQEIVVRFKREAELLARLRSDRVARVVDFLVDPACGSVLVTELVDGQSLWEKMARQSFGVEEAVDLGIEMARALAELHCAHIVHRDLKPGNIIVQARDDGGCSMVIVDLGVSRLLASEDSSDDALTALTKTHIVLGTLEYMAPEQICGASEVTETADVYSLGAILFRMVAGHNLFREVSRASLVRSKLKAAAPRLETGRADAFARGFEVLVARALDGDPALRFQNAGEMLSALLRLRDTRGKASRVPLAARAPAASRGGARGRAWQAVGAAAIAAVVFSCGAAAGAFSLARIAPARVASTPTEPPPKVVLSASTGGPTSAQEQPFCDDFGQGDNPSGSVCRATDSQAPIANASQYATDASRAVADASRAAAADASRARKRQARDAALLKAMQQAVEEEAYMMLIVPERLAATSYSLNVL